MNKPDPKNEHYHVALDEMIEWAKKPVGTRTTRVMIIGDLFCVLELRLNGSWSEMQAKQAGENIKWVMKH